MEITVNVTNDRLTIDVKIEGSGPPGKTPVKGVDYWTDEDKREIIDEVLEEIPGGGNFPYKLGPTLKVVDSTLDVNTADDVQQDNTLPITSAAVYQTVGNIDILLGTI